MLWLRGNHTANYRGCVEWKEAKTTLSKQAPDLGRKSASTDHLTTPKEQWAEPPAEQMDLGEGWNDVVRRGRVVKATTPPNLIPNPPSQPVTEDFEKPKVTATRKTARPQKSKPKTTAAPKLPAGSLRRKQPRMSKPRSKSKVSTPHSRKFLISSITFPSMLVSS